MNKRSTTPVSTSFRMRGSLLAIAILMAAAAPMAFFASDTAARDFNAEIQAVQRQIDQYNNEASRLASEANTLQTEVARLENEKAIIQAQIDLKQAEYDKLVAEIEANEKKMADNQDALGTIMADMYVDDDISPLLMLASSKTITDYVDKQNKRSSVRDQLSKKIAEIKELKAKLEKQRAEVKQNLEDQTNQRNLLAAKQAEQQQLLDATRGQEAAYKQLSAESQAKRKELERQQAAELAARARQVGGGYASVPGDPNRGGYPSHWANAPMNAYVDSWGMYSRQCVSYAAFKVNQAYGNMPYWGGDRIVKGEFLSGHAKYWARAAELAGIPTGYAPKVGSVGVVTTGTYGHVAWVEAVNPDGTIRISHYNVGWNGEYAVWDNLHPSYFNKYIYFGG